MLRFSSEFGRTSLAKTNRPRRPRSFRASLEAVEDRKLLSSITGVSYSSGGAWHSEVFALGYNNTVSMSKDGGALTSESGYLTEISAGLDSAGNPEVYGIGANNAVWVDDNNTGWVSRGGYVTAIAATVDNTVFAIGGNGTVYVNFGGTSWGELGTLTVKAISAGTDSWGIPEVYAIDNNNAVWSSDNLAPWVSRGGGVTAIAGSTDGTVFAIGTDGSPNMNRSGTSWYRYGGYAREITAGSDINGNPEAYIIGGNAAAYVSDNGSAFTEIGGYVTELAGSSRGTVFARGGDAEQLFFSQFDLPFQYIASVPLANPAAGAAYSPAPSSAPLFNGGSPSYLDMDQGAEGDCWLDASLAEVAARDPQVIKNMFVYDGTTVDNGAKVGLYQVLLYSPTGIGFYIQVDTDLPDGGTYYNSVTNGLGTQALWPALAEKAYAEACALGFVQTHFAGMGSYDAMNGGNPCMALPAITGNPETGQAINTSNIAAAWNAGQLVVLDTGTPSSSLIEGGHDYALVGYNASSSQPFEIYNPWGTLADGYVPGYDHSVYGLFTASSNFVSQNFIEQDTSAEAAKTNLCVPNPTNDPTDALTVEETSFKKSVVVQGIGRSNLSYRHLRPVVGMMTVGGPLS